MELRMTRPSKPWTTRPWPTAHWTENTLEGRGTMLDPQETISHLIAWTAVAFSRLRRDFDEIPEPDVLSAPGWYPDPVTGHGER